MLDEDTIWEMYDRAKREYLTFHGMNPTYAYALRSQLEVFEEVLELSDGHRALRK